MKLRFFVAAVAALFAVSSVQAQVIWTEDFESVTLGPSPQERPVPPVPVWTETPPAGWTVDNSGVPGQGDDEQGMEDWEGWAFVDEAFWVSADDQRRSEFRDGFGEGVVAVADPDEWDDVGSPADQLGFFNAFMTTPSIDISSVTEQLEISFASSWRDEAFDDGDAHNPNGNNQTAILSLSLDGGAFAEVLRWESDPASASFKDDAPNEMIELNLGATSASTAQFQFALVEGGNDWWWAVDNIEVSNVPEPSAGLMGFVAAAALALAARKRR